MRDSILNKSEKSFIQLHKGDDIKSLALRMPHIHGIDNRMVLQQISGYQKAMNKIPSWADNPDMLYPPEISMEQCSSEITARYKRRVLENLRTGSDGKIKRFADITGGFGIDCAFMAGYVKDALYVEMNDELCGIAENNFRVLGLGNIITVVHGNGIKVLEDCIEDNDSSHGGKPFDLIFADPSRRDRTGGRVVAISDCEPDISLNKPLLFKSADMILLKLSPMLDLASTLNLLPETSQVHIVSVDGECREMLLLLDSNHANDVAIVCANMLHEGAEETFYYKKSEENNSCVCYAEKPGKFLYEPNASIMKAAPFGLISEKFNVKELHPNSHLFTSDVLNEDFPGRIFEVISSFPCNKKNLRLHIEGEFKANLTVRNFPETVAGIRKTTGLKEGGNDYIFATTLYEGTKVAIQCRKI